jgi:uncharacterized RDD family membrane protein YckC
MSSDQPGPGSPEDPFAKPPGGQGGSPYDTPPPGGSYGGGPYDGGTGGGSYGGGTGGSAGPGNPYGGGPQGDPFAGMPPLADSGRRVLARIVDLIIVLIPAGVLDWASGGTDDFSSGNSAMGGAFLAVIGFLYEWFMTASSGQSVGKKLVRIRAAMLDDGSVPTAAASALRALVLWLPAFCCACVWFAVVGISVLLDKPYRQGLHDRAAKTVVVQTA